MSKYYAVIDTNVIVSALIKADSIPGTLLELVFSGMVIPIYNDEILKEYQEVLSRPKFKIKNEEVITIVEAIKSSGKMMMRKLTSDELPDPKDVVFYEVTLTGRDEYDAKLVTGNIKHFPKKEYIVTPRQMLEIIIDKMSRHHCKSVFLF